VHGLRDVPHGMTVAWNFLYALNPWILGLVLVLVLRLGLVLHLQLPEIPI